MENGEVTRAETDFSALLIEAIRAKAAEEARKYEEVEETPPGEVLTWNVTPEQIARINAGERAAIDEFYFANIRRIKFSAYQYIRKNYYLKALITYEDLINQVYVDLRTGLIKLRPYDGGISSPIFHSFRYAAVGGADEIFIPKIRRNEKCQKQAN